MFQFFSSFSQTRKAWLLLAVISFLLELTALFFQYGMKLDPCVMCVYERTAMMGMMFAGLLGAIAPQLLILRIMSFGLWIVSSAWGLQLAWQHTQFQINPNPFSTCDFFASYPSWFKLDTWAPWMFNPTGYCDQVSWMFLGWSMPQWLILIFAISLVSSLLFFASQWKLIRRR
ncbi:disulfide bond formation protein DsbB [Alginatibacterium sediminis]|uniref:Disulfide bond formation protein B n=1 Tax=Alginatibacterium sediminis TaxID=2164068 RepID=A0A420EIA1_9ALTE|nr:disulfide bond formation protein DsbB [Alginatibacterium sediminis]RKF20415.1 disulfide bond formation protein DsbB [Alginatibacterium sediminis]